VKKPTPAFRLPSRITGTDYAIYLAVPRRGADRERWPVVFFLDGDDQFVPAVAAYRALRRAKKNPPLLLVGVGYGASYTKPGNRRGRDYTPTPHSDEPTSGGGEAFLGFLMQELWPEIARRYRVRANARGIAGHSLGSLLVLQALFHEPGFFTHYLASAPSIWWDNRSILRLAAERRTRNAMLDAQLFLSVGDEDTPSMTGDLTLLEEQLAAQPFEKLRRTSQRFPGRNHYNVIQDAFRAGLTALFANRAGSSRVKR
jgi:predicted alpha/beta superfamily hydrolase